MEKNQSYLMNLAAIIYQDGKLDSEEFSLIHEIADKLDIDHTVVNELLSQREEFEFIIPDTEDEKISQIKGMAQMMGVDGHIDKREKELITSIAQKFGLSNEKLDFLNK